jgi:flavin-dependent dehydrogenase
MENTYDVIVIGAGAAGLTAAYELSKHKPKCKLIVLEARGRPEAFYKRLCRRSNFSFRIHKE